MGGSPEIHFVIMRASDSPMALVGKLLFNLMNLPFMLLIHVGLVILALLYWIIGVPLWLLGMALKFILSMFTKDEKTS